MIFAFLSDFGEKTFVFYAKIINPVLIATNEKYGNQVFVFFRFLSTQKRSRVIFYDINFLYM